MKKRIKVKDLRLADELTNLGAVVDIKSHVKGKLWYYTIKCDWGILVDVPPFYEVETYLSYKWGGNH